MTSLDHRTRWLRRMAKVGSRRDRRRHRAFLLFRAEKDGLANRAFYQRGLRVLPLP